MENVVQNRGAFVAMKTGMTTATLLVSERLWKNRRTTTWLMMAALNGTYATIAADDAQVDLVAAEVGQASPIGPRLTPPALDV